MHGANAGRPPTHGRTARSIPKDMLQLYEDYLADPNILDLAPEIAQIRAWWARFSKQFDGSAIEPCQACGKAALPVSAEVLAEMRAFSDAVRKLVEAKHKIEYGEQYTLNIGTIGAVIEQMQSAIADEIDDPAVLERIAQRFERLGGRG